jgi:glycerol-3-phosphate cytidylyltransferase
MITGFTCGAMDLLHPGHLAMLSYAKGYCDYLIVGLHTNPQIDRPEKNKPLESVFERWMRLKACKWVDEIVPYDTEADLINLLQTLTIDIRFLSEEYAGKDFTGKGIVKEHFNPRRHTFSSTQLRKRLCKS